VIDYLARLVSDNQALNVVELHMAWHAEFIKKHQARISLRKNELNTVVWNRHSSLFEYLHKVNVVFSGQWDAWRKATGFEYGSDTAQASGRRFFYTFEYQLLM
jgi:hypothetical protein